MAEGDEPFDARVRIDFYRKVKIRFTRDLSLTQSVDIDDINRRLRSRSSSHGSKDKSQAV